MKALIWLPTDSITINPDYQNLFPPLSMDVYEELREDIKKVGVLVPLILEHHDSGYSVLAGHHRLKAANELGLEQVPCEVVETQEEHSSALFDNIHRRQLSPNELKKFKENEQVWRSTRVTKIPSALKDLCNEFPLERILPAHLWSQLMLSPPSQVNHISKSLKCTLDKIKAKASTPNGIEKSSLSRSQPRSSKDTEYPQELEELRKTAVGLSREVQKRNQDIERLEEELQAQKRKMNDAQALLKAFQMQDPLTITPGIIVEGFQTLSQLLRVLLDWTTQLPTLNDDFQGKIDRAIAQLLKILNERGQKTGHPANLRIVNGHKQPQPAHP